MDSEKIIEKKQLENGVELQLIDSSRVMVGDRWLVELKCEAHITVDENCWDMIEEENQELLQNIRESFGGRLVFATTKQRNFVDAADCETVFQEMMQQFKGSVLDYLNSPNFPQEFFRKQYQESRQKLLIQKAMGQEK